MLLAGGHDGGLGAEQGDGLPLHVGAHQGAVGVVVLEEGDHGGGHRHHHLGGDVHIVHPVLIHGDGLVAVAAGDPFVDQTALLVHRLGGLGDDILVLHIGGHIGDLVGEPAGLLVHLPVGGLDEAVLVDPGVGGQIGDQADVGTFGGLDGAQPAVVGVVNVTDVEGGPVPAQTAGAQSGQTALVGQLGQGVGLVHELGQGGGAKKLLDGGGDRPDVDQALGGDHIQVLGGHPLPDHTLHAAEADAELVLDQLAHAAQAAVAQVVDVVRGADVVGQTVQVVDGGHDVGHGDVVGDQLLLGAADRFLQLAALVLLQQLAQHGEGDHLVDAHLRGVEAGEGGEALLVHHVVGEYHHQLAVHVHHSPVHTSVVQLLGPLPGENLASLGDDLAGEGVGDGLGQPAAGQPGPQSHLFVELVAAYGGQVVPPVVEEGGVDQGLGGVQRGGLAGTQLAVDLQHGILVGLAGVLLQGGQDALVLAKQLQNLRIGAGPHGPNEAGDGQLAVLVDADVEHIAQVGLILQPGAPAGDDGGGVGLVVRLVHLAGVVHARGADDLRDDDTLGPVDDEGARVGHDGEVPHKDLLLIDLVVLGVAQLYPHLDGGGVGGVPGLALLHVVLGLFVHGEVHEGQLQVAAVVHDGAHIPEHLFQADVQKPLVRGFLYLQQVGHLQDLLVPGEALSWGLAIHYVLDDHAEKSTRFLQN